MSKKKHVLKPVEVDGAHYIDSRDIAELLSRSHSNVLISIDRLLDRVKHRDTGEADQFIKSTYPHTYNGRDERRYLITQEGCALLADRMSKEASFELYRSVSQAFQKLKDEGLSEHE